MSWGSKHVVAAVTAGLLISLGWTAAAEDDAQLAATRMFNATAALQNGGLYERAATRWEQYLGLYPGDDRAPQVNYYLGICRLHAQQYDEAAAAFRGLIAEFPRWEDLAAARYHLGMALYQAARAEGGREGYLAAAAALAEAAGGGGRYAAQALYLQAESLYAAGAKEASLEVYQKLIGEHPESSLVADAYYFLGVAQQELGQHREAATTFAAFLADRTRGQHAHAREVRLRLGTTLFDLQDYAAAERQLGVVASATGYAHADLALLRQSQCRLALGQAEGAIELLLEFLLEHPDSASLDDALLILGKAYFELREFDEAARWFDPLARSGDSRRAAEGAYWLARAHLKRGKAGDALAIAESGLSKPDQGAFAPFLEVARIEAVYELPERRDAVGALCEAFIAKYPRSEMVGQVLHTAGLAALQEGDFAAAQKYASAFLARPGAAEHALLPAVRFVQAESHLLIGEPEESGGAQQALAVYRDLVSQFPDHPLAGRGRVRIGWCLYRDQAYEEAISYLEQVIDDIAESDDVAEAYYLIGRSREAAEEHRRAVAAFDAALAAAPAWSRADEVLLAAAQSLHSLGADAQAQSRLSQFVAGYPDSPRKDQALYLSGEIARGLEDGVRAVAEFTKVLEQFPRSEFAPAAAYGIAAAYFAAEDYRRAGAALDRLIETYPASASSLRGRYLRGICRQRQQDYAGAIRDFEDYTSGDPAGPNATDARYALAVCELEFGRPSAAVSRLTSLAREHPDYEHLDKVYYDLGHGLLAMQKADDASAAFAELIEKRPASPHVPECWFHVGSHQERAAETLPAGDESARLFERARRSYANGLELAEAITLREKLAYKLGALLFKQGDYAAALRQLTSQVGEFPQGELRVPALFLAGQSAYRLNGFDQALALLSEVAEEDEPQFRAQALYLAGASAGNLKRWTESRSFYESLLQSFPQFDRLDEVRYGIGWALQNEGRVEEARGVYEQVAGRSNSEAAAKAEFMLGELDFADEKYEAAIEHFLEVALGYPYAQWQALGHFEAGRCWIELGRRDQAIASLTTVIERHPEHEKAASAATILAELKK